MVAERETNIVSVERIDEYAKTPSEAPFDIQLPPRRSDDDDDLHKPIGRLGLSGFADVGSPLAFRQPGFDPNWPSEGGIIFEDLEMRYRPHLDLVLRRVRFSIKPCEKIGIVGRFVLSCFSRDLNYGSDASFDETTFTSQRVLPPSEQSRNCDARYQKRCLFCRAGRTFRILFHRCGAQTTGNYSVFFVTRFCRQV